MSDLIDEINKIRGTDKGISYATILKHAEEFPLLSHILKNNPATTARRKISQSLSCAGYQKRSQRSTYWFAPEEPIDRYYHGERRGF